MKKISAYLVSAVISVLCVQASAEYKLAPQYSKTPVPTISPENREYVIPDGSDYEMLPAAIPCVGSNYGIRCNYLMYPTKVTLVSEGEYVTVPLETRYICRMGKCRSSYGDAGNFPEDVTAIVNIWYRLEQSEEGDLVAIRRDMDGTVRNAEAGASLLIFFLEAGIPMEIAKAAMEYMYIGGWKKYEQDHRNMCEDPSHDMSYCGD